jgi:AraC-like DNA-binding protein
MKNTNLLSRDFFDDTLLKLKVIERNPQVPFPLHSHDFAELVIVLSGSGIHFTEGAEYRIMPGDVFVIENGFSHGFKKLDNLRLYNIIFAPQILKQVFIDIQKMPGYHAVFTVEPKFRDIHAFESRLQLNSEQLQYCDRLISRMNIELAETDSANGNRAMALAYFIELVVYLSRIYTQVPVDSSREILRMAELFVFLQTHLDQSITIDELSAHANMSPSTLHRAFHRTVQCSPIEYHLQLRIDHAQNLLKHSRLSISQISEASGFSDSNYFSRQFRKRIGMSPRAYKKSTAGE